MQIDKYRSVHCKLKVSRDLQEIRIFETFTDNNVTEPTKQSLFMPNITLTIRR